TNHIAPMRFGGLELTWHDPWRDLRLEAMPWGFSVGFDEHQDRCTVTFDACIYDPARVRAFINHFVRLLDAASRHPDLPLATLLAMSEIAASSLSGAKRWWSFAKDMFHCHTWRTQE